MSSRELCRALVLGLVMSAAACGSSGGAGASGGAPGAGGVPGTGGAIGYGGIAGTVKVMPLGDSITASTCWRATLWQELNQSGRQGRFDMVGSNRSNSDPRGGGCTPSSADADNEGHGSCLVTEIVNNVDASVSRGCNTTLAALTPALTTDAADVVLMHFGTNDVWNNIATAKILAAYGTMIDSLRAVNPNVVVLMAKIIPMNVTASTCSGCSCPACTANISNLNGMMATWAAGKSTDASPVVVVDQFSNFDATADTVDGVHPNASGAQKMADVWFTALSPLILAN